MKYHIIYRYRTEYPVVVMCAFFGVSRSGYYAFVPVSYTHLDVYKRQVTRGSC